MLTFKFLKRIALLGATCGDRRSGHGAPAPEHHCDYAKKPGFHGSFSTGCGRLFTDFDAAEHGDTVSVPNFCFNCGGRVRLAAHPQGEGENK